MKILVVDDEDDVRLVARMSLERLGGMSVTEVSGGDQAVAAAVRERPDAVLLDVTMPGMDGIETLAALRADAETASIPVIFLTARAMPGEVEHLKQLGALDVLTKPFDPAMLPARVRALLQRP